MGKLTDVRILLLKLLQIALVVGALIAMITATNHYDILLANALLLASAIFSMLLHDVARFDNKYYASMLFRFFVVIEGSGIYLTIGLFIIGLARRLPTILPLLVMTEIATITGVVGCELLSCYLDYKAGTSVSDKK